VVEAAGFMLAAGSCYLGCACLALALPRHWKEVSGDAALPSGWAPRLRATGGLLLVAGAAGVVLREGPAFGGALAVLLLTTSAWAVAATLTWRPHWLRPLTSYRSAPRPPRSLAEASLAALFTATVWLSCLVVGVVGLALPLSAPPLRPPEPPPVIAELVEVQLGEPPPEPAPAESPPPDPLLPPPLASLAAPPPSPTLVAVAPSAQIAFALPVQGATVVTDPRLASHHRPSVAAGRPAAAPQVQTITYGQGEGKQPAPDYPSQALREGQEGAVVVRFRVAEDGRVQSATVARPSPWSLLDMAAVRVVRERWSFRPGPPRLYEVSIRFQLTK
jgi:protein TonB